MKKRCFIIEGVCGAGKTTLLKSVQQSLGKHGISVVSLEQKLTYAPIAPLEDLGLLNDSLHVAILSRVIEHIVSVFEQIEEKQVLLVDTLHITQYCRTYTLSEHSFRKLEKQLQILEPVIFFLPVTYEQIFERTIQKRRGTGFEKYAKKFGESEEERARYFLEEQQRMLSLLSTSCLDRFIAPKGQTKQEVLSCFVDLVLDLFSKATETP